MWETRTKYQIVRNLNKTAKISIEYPLVIEMGCNWDGISGIENMGYVFVNKITACEISIL